MRRFLIGLLVAQPTFVLANDGWWVGVGGAKGFGRHESIRMAKERLRIVLREKDVLVRATFWFQNQGPAKSVQIGFPEERNNQEEPAMRRFQTWVDGKRLLAKRKALSSDKENRDYEAVWLKSVWFGRGQSRRVEVSYLADYSGNSSGGSGFSYILSTGASWAGKIADCRVTIEWPSSRKRSRPYLMAFKGKLAKPDFLVEASSARREVYRFRNLEPDFDLHWTMAPGFWHFNVNGRRAMPPLPDGERLNGQRSDLLLPLTQLEDLFGRPYSIASGDGDFSVESRGDEFLIRKVFFDQLDVGVNLRRRARWLANLYGNRSPHVYLKDVVRALGGSYKVVPRLDRVDIRLPAPRG